MSNQVTPETKKASTVLDKSTRALAVGQTAFGKVIAELQSGVDTLALQQANLAQDIEFKGRELAEVTAQTDTAVRDAKIDLDFRVRENEGKVLAELLRKTGQVASTQAELNELAETAQAAEVRATQTEFAAVKSAEQSLHAKYGSEIAGLKSDHKVEIAQLNANAQRDSAMLKALTDQVASLQTTIVANREAETARTQALAQSSITVNNCK